MADHVEVLRELRKLCDKPNSAYGPALDAAIRALSPAGGGITADWVVGYLPMYADADTRKAVRYAFAEYEALLAASPQQEPGAGPTMCECGEPERGGHAVWCPMSGAVPFDVLSIASEMEAACPHYAGPDVDYSVDASKVHTWAQALRATQPAATVEVECSDCCVTQWATGEKCAEHKTPADESSGQTLAGAVVGCAVDLDNVKGPTLANREEVPHGLLDRIKAAEQRIADGHAPRRIPAEVTDVDLVLAEVRAWIEGKHPPFWIAPADESGASGQTLAGAGGELARIVELANRLVASGPKAAHVSASECHEIRDFIVDLTATSAGTTGDALPELPEPEGEMKWTRSAGVCIRPEPGYDADQMREYARRARGEG